jgi:hypothetical protein
MEYGQKLLDLVNYAKSKSGHYYHFDVTINFYFGPYSKDVQRVSVTVCLDPKIRGNWEFSLESVFSKEKNIDYNELKEWMDDRLDEIHRHLNYYKKEKKEAIQYLQEELECLESLS